VGDELGIERALMRILELSRRLPPNDPVAQSPLSEDTTRGEPLLIENLADPNWPVETGAVTEH